jgi:hypothetical protein
MVALVGMVGWWVALSDIDILPGATCVVPMATV